ncbi:MAG TPA: acyl-CoA synthetase [Acidimicrobiaceae bacterium]|nr:acyl-CoA synthetase [Acidimicrobiaceae bacterium]
MPAPWLSPQVVRRNECPKVLPTLVEHRCVLPTDSVTFLKDLSGRIRSLAVAAVDGQLNLATAWEAVADELGETRPAVSVSGRHICWAEFEDRAARLATTLLEHGLGRNSKVALYLYNGREYPEAQFATFKLRAVPANVNYRYNAEELAYILENSDAEALFYDHTLEDQVEEARHRCPRLRLLVRVGGEQREAPDWSVQFELAATADPANRIDRSGSDLWFLYTGGTTGMPKAVMWDHQNLFGGMEGTFRPFGEVVPTTPSEAAATARRIADTDKEIRQLCAAPLMHGTSGIPGLATLSHGGMLATLVARSFDADELWSLVARDRITMITMVGDAFGRPMLESLDRAAAEGQPFDLSSLRLLVSSGVVFSGKLKEALLDHHPCTILDSLGSSEGTGMASQITSRRRSSQLASETSSRFMLSEHTRVFNEQNAEVVPGSGEQGRLATAWPLPIGYFKDPEKTEKTFPTINGRRWSIPGDWATVELDGTITLLGRGSGCINTGGEKVYPEEIEELLKGFEEVTDCNVVGIDDERWGQAVAAVVELAVSGSVGEEELCSQLRTRVAAYKVPKKVVFVDRLLRSPSGKSDYRWARETILASSSDGS